MARVIFDNNKLKEKRLNKHAPVKYTCYIDQVQGLFQIDTYGSEERKVQGKVSQSIQMDKDASKELVKLLTKFINL